MWYSIYVRNLSDCSHMFEKITWPCKRRFHRYQKYFESSSEWLIGFKVHDKRYLQFCRISNWSKCRSQFWGNHITLVNLPYFFLKSSHCYHPNVHLNLLWMDFAIWNLWYTLPSFLLNIRLEQLQITVLFTWP